MRTKICGITDLDDARYAIEQGAWALGFNFHVKSPRFIEPYLAAAIIRELPAHIVKVGVVVDTTKFECLDLMTHVGLDLIQVYQDLDVSLSLKKRLILCLHAMTFDELPPHDVLCEYGHLLLDAPKLADGLLGGTGRLSNWDLASQMAKRYRLLLAGGLNPENVLAAVQTVHPYAVDVCGGVQSTPGRIDQQRLHDFLKEVHYER